VFETNPDDDRMTLAKVGFILAAVLLIAILATRNLFWLLAKPGRLPRPSFALILIAISCLALMFRSLASTFRAKKLLALAFALAGTQAAVRAVLWLAGASRGWQYITTMAGEMLTALAAIIVIFVAVDWLKSANGEQPPSDRENPAS
jgi:hypothetical protein